MLRFLTRHRLHLHVSIKEACLLKNLILCGSMCRCLRPAGPRCWPSRGHGCAGSCESRFARGGAGSLAKADGSPHWCLLQVYPGALDLLTMCLAHGAEKLHCDGPLSLCLEFRKHSR